MSATSARFAPVDYAAVLEVFLAESQEGLAAMEQALLALETHPDDESQVQTLFRLAHTLKGNAASLGLADLAALTHALEDVLERLRSHQVGVTDEVVTLLLESLDALGEMLAEAEWRR